eukprot:c9845_g1_i1.p1 GENE.c9845_g1_i1~~c9845_g1_i1.p1  ORF type:complete len:258 (+),score=56.63 c9845_g1_i1:7-780(+)
MCSFRVALPRPRDPSMTSQLAHLVSYHDSIFNTFTTVNTTSNILSLIAHVLERRHGSEHDLVKGIRQLAGGLGASAGRGLVPGGILADVYNGLTGDWVGGWKSNGVANVVKWQSWVLTGYYLAEHTAWVGTVAPSLVAVNTSRLYMISNRLWLVWVVMGFVGLALRFEELKKAAKEMKALQHRENIEAIKEKRRILNLHLIRMFLRLLPAIQWTLTSTTLISPVTSQFLCALDGILGTYLAWNGLGTSAPTLKQIKK